MTETTDTPSEVQQTEQQQTPPPVAPPKPNPAEDPGHEVREIGPRPKA